MASDLTGRRAIVLGAETPIGQALCAALGDAGAVVAAVAATTAAEASFAAKRAARRAGRAGRQAIAQAIDAGNEMAVRVMVRQVSKAMGGLDLLFFAADLGLRTDGACTLAIRFAAKEMAKQGSGAVVVLQPADRAPPSVEALPPGINISTVQYVPEPGGLQQAVTAAMDAAARHGVST